MNDTSTHRNATSAGLVLGSYRILHELSSGGMGTVFRAQHVLLGRPAAVKLLRRDLTATPELVQRFVNEARAVAACKHPGIVEVYDFGYTADGHAYIVMEFLEGESLGNRLARVRLGEREAAAIAQGIASALKAAHRVGVIHRDLKPDNVFLVADPDGGIDHTKVLDFGIAKLADVAPAAGQTTQTGALIGTPLYMAPEQARAPGAIDHRADLYSLGCILYHMLAGKPPFVAEGAGEIIALQMFETAVPPSQLAPVTPDMERLVLRLLAKDPADRFPTAGDVVTALAGLDERPSSRRTRLPDPLGTPGPPDPLCPPNPPNPIDSGIAIGAPDHRQPGTLPSPAAAPRTRSVLPFVSSALAVLAVAAVAVRYARTQGDERATAPAAALSSAPAAPSASQPSATPPTPQPSSPAPQPSAPPPSPQPPSPASQPAATPTTTPLRSTTQVPAPESPKVAAPGSATPPPSMLAPQRAATGSGVAKPPHAPHVTGKPARGAHPNVGSITAPTGRGLPDAPEGVHRTREVEPAKTGDHTAGGHPLENSVDLDPKPKRNGSVPAPPSPSPP